MSQQRQFNNNLYNDTTFTKIFVGGLAWETQRDTMRRYFEQFGEILEAVVITDKNSGRSKGYGFVTFKDPDAAMRACQNSSPTIDGRRANCNLASLGAQKSRSPTPQHGGGRFRSAPGLMESPVYHHGSSSTFIQPNGQYSVPYSAYGYTGYSQDNIYPLNYYGLYGGQQYYIPGASMAPGMFHNLYPFYAQNSQGHGFGVQYPQMLQYPYLPQHHSSSGILSLPSSVPMAATSSGDCFKGPGFFYNTYGKRTAVQYLTVNFPTENAAVIAAPTTPTVTTTTIAISSSEPAETTLLTTELLPSTTTATTVTEPGPSQASTEKKPSS